MTDWTPPTTRYRPTTSPSKVDPIASPACTPRPFKLGRLPLAARDRIVMVVDEGVATGATMVTALHYANFAQVEDHEVIALLNTAMKAIDQ